MNTIGLGNALVDVLLQMEDDNILSGIGVKKGAMEMISKEQMITIQESNKALKRTLTPGGSVCNTMRAMGLLGANVGYIGKIGKDEYATFYEEALRKAGVHPNFIRTAGVSGCCTVLISPDGERTMCTFLGPAPTIQPDEISDTTLAGYDCIYIEGYLLVNEALVRSTMQKAKSKGMRIALDLSNFNIVNGFKALLEEIIPEYVDILFSNESEAEAFTGLKAEDAVKKLSTWVDISLVTLGKEGALVGSKGKIIRIPAEGGKPKDTTGAGDHFAAGFLYGQSIGATLEQSASIGSLLAGYIIDVIGPQIPTDKWEQIKLKVKKLVCK
ncbi:MAG: adenosine kinase [Massilibacteroides sp.]|nr:adenosine kinase [Massilibacteroides sp.]MDD3062995.1 adenosine kinase [Massilibacteroides sp.]MDD4115114.1 adenosine kinase [Massilibacteroides sp.]MDD4660986.1 adenosine kinase [Massilibacteroides sp.]